MSENNGYKVVKEGDTLIIYLAYNDLHQIKVERGKIFQIKFGAIKHDDLIGKCYGSIYNCPKGWVYILKLTPELWTETLTHRTQILYIPDISLVIFQLDLKPGSFVCEAGVGSGSMSYSLLQAIGPEGHLYTHDFHQERAALMSEKFSELKLGSRVTVTHRDVCAQGFDLPRSVDAVFLDLPEAWCALSFTPSIFNKETGGRICSFSPCIEQVQKTCQTLEDMGFLEIETMECLQRKFEVKKLMLPSTDVDSKEEQSTPITTAIPSLTMAGHTGFLTFATFPPLL